MSPLRILRPYAIMLGIYLVVLGIVAVGTDPPLQERLMIACGGVAVAATAVVMWRRMR